MSQSLSTASIGSAATISERPTAPISQPLKPLLSPTADLLLAGGASILFYVLMRLIIKPGVAFDALSSKIYLLSLAVNYPHLMVSYQLLYGDRRQELFKTPAYLWAAVGAPIVLVGVTTYACLFGSPMLLSELLRAMFILVGWHYVKQSYGAVMVFSARERFFMNDHEKTLLRYNMYVLWALHFLAFNKDVHNVNFMGVVYRTLALPQYLTYITYAALIGTLLMAGRALCQRRDQTGRWPPAAAVAAFAAIYIWYLPMLFDSSFYRIMPFFHSLQYLLFVLCLKRNQGRCATASLPAAAGRARFLLGFVTFCIVAAVVGYIVFEPLPSFLDRVMPTAMAGTPTFFAFAFMVVINIHHYFIDNVVWRRDNQGLKQHLFSA